MIYQRAFEYCVLIMNLYFFVVYATKQTTRRGGGLNVEMSNILVLILVLKAPMLSMNLGNTLNQNS